MTTICWTILHHAAVPVAHGGTRAIHAARHFLGPVAHRTARLTHHASITAAQPHTWVELVCKAVPAALIGGGLLVPIPATAPRIPEPPPAMVEPSPVAVPWLPLNWRIPPTLSTSASYGVGEGPAVKMSEPSAASLLFGGIGGLLLIRLTRRRSRHAGNVSPGGGQPCLSETDALHGGPVLRTLE
jgi:hypothetical protein